MNILYRLFFVLFLFSFVNKGLQAQCQIKKELSPTGVYTETTEKELIYFNNEYSIYSQAKHDGDNYFLILIAKPFLKKELESRSIKILLKNKDIVQLELYDVNYRTKDSTINLLYKIANSDLKSLSEIDMEEVMAKINLNEKDFILKLHKDIIRKQLKCLNNSAKE